MHFEWEENKRRENIRKHGFDFVDAWKIFEAPVFTEIDDREDYGEDRWIGIGLLDARVIVIVFTERDEDTIRVISLRKALSHEREKYEQTLRDRLGAH
jgi:hypothetical protein